MSRSERYDQAIAEVISEIKSRCEDARIRISNQPYVGEDANIRVYPPDSWTLDQGLDLGEQMAAFCSDLFLEGGPFILVLVSEPPDKVKEANDQFQAEMSRKKAS